MHKWFVIGLVVAIVLLSILYMGFLGNKTAVENINSGITKTAHSVIRINSDSDFDTAHGVVGGSGTQKDPYIISDWDIDAGGAGAALFVGNTTKYFVVRNCSLHNAYYRTWPTPSIYFSGGAVTLVNVKNGIIEKSKMYDSSYNVYADSVTNVVIKENDMGASVWESIRLYYDSDILIKDNYIHDSVQGAIYIWDSTNNMVYSNTMVNCSIWLWSLHRDTFITQDIPDNNTVNGKPVYYYKNADMGGASVPTNAGQVLVGNVSNLNIENLNIDQASVPIEVGFSNHINVMNNNLLNSWEGILFSYSEFSRIENNTSSGHLRYGIRLFYSNYTKIANNTIRQNRWDGIQIYNGHYNIIRENLLENNDGYGVRIDSTNSNNFYSSSHNLVFNNSFYYNHHSFDSYDPSYVQAYDDGTNNYWNSTEGIGNYWHDWANNNDTNDESPQDGIVDWPYNLDGGATSKDYYPLKNPEIPIPELSWILAILLIFLVFVITVQKRK